jgi:hypothetical protein
MTSELHRHGPCERAWRTRSGFVDNQGWPFKAYCGGRGSLVYVDVLPTCPYYNAKETRRRQSHIYECQPFPLRLERLNPYPGKHPTRNLDERQGNARTGAQQLRLCLTGAGCTHDVVVHSSGLGQGSGLGHEAPLWVVNVGQAPIIGLASGGRRTPAGALVFDAKVVGGTFAAAQLAPRKGPSCTDGPHALHAGHAAAGTEYHL